MDPIRRAGPVLALAPFLLGACEMVPDIGAWTQGDAEETALESDNAPPDQSTGEAVAASAAATTTTSDLDAVPDIEAPPPPIDPAEYLTLATLDTRREALPAPEDDGNLGLELDEVSKARAWVEELADTNRKRKAQNARAKSTETAAAQQTAALPTAPPAKPAAPEPAATSAEAATPEPAAANDDAATDRPEPDSAAAQTQLAAGAAASTKTETDAPVADAKAAAPDFDAVFASIGVVPRAPEAADGSSGESDVLSAEAQAAGEKAAAPTTLVAPALDQTGEPAPMAQLAAVTTDQQGKSEAIAEMTSQASDAQAAPEAEQQVANLAAKIEPDAADALEPAKEIGNLRILFAEDSSDLTPRAEADLAAFAQQVLGKQDAGVRILAYAKGSEDAVLRARRTSLSRSLAVRSFLINKGIPKVKVDLAAMGDKYKDGPPDRVDLVVVER